MNDPQTYYDAALLLHGHRCPAMPLGLRAGAAAMNVLGVERSGAGTLEAILELGDGHCAHCFADGVQMVTGCTFGKGNIRKTGVGKFGLTLVDRQTGRSVRVVPRAEAQLKTKGSRENNLYDSRASAVGLRATGAAKRRVKRFSVGPKAVACGL